MQRLHDRTSFASRYWLDKLGRERHDAIRMLHRLSRYVRCYDSQNCPDIRPDSEAYDWPSIKGRGRVCPACLALEDADDFLSRLDADAKASR